MTPFSFLCENWVRNQEFKFVVTKTLSTDCLKNVRCKVCKVKRWEMRAPSALVLVAWGVWEFMIFDSPPIGLIRMNVVHFFCMHICVCFGYQLTKFQFQETSPLELMRELTSVSFTHPPTPTLEFAHILGILHCAKELGCGALGQRLSIHTGYTRLFSVSVTVATSGRWFCCVRASILTEMT